MKRILSAYLGLVCLISLVACGGATGGTETGNATPSGVGYAVGDSIDTVTGMLDSDPDFDTVASLPWQSLPRATAKKHFSFFPSAMAAPACVIEATCDDTNHTSTFIKDFSAGCDTGDGFTVEGKRYISWFDMGPNACTGPTAKPLFLNAIQGDGAHQIHSTDVIPASGTCGTPQTSIDYNFDDGARLEITQCGLLEYLNFVSTGPGESTVTEALSLPFAHRVFLRPNGSKLYDHSLSTPAALQVDLIKDPSQNRPNKTIHSGTVRVVHNIAQFSVDTDYQEVVWDYNQCLCYPVSGTIQFSATNLVTGQSLGSGSLTFDKDSTGSCRIAQANFQGQNLNILLHSCRGI